MKHERMNQPPAVLAQGSPCLVHSATSSEPPRCVCPQGAPAGSDMSWFSIAHSTGCAPHTLSSITHDPTSQHDNQAQAPLGTTTSAPKLLVTVEEAAQQLSIGRPKMWQLVMRGEVLSIKIGASRRIPVAAVEEYVQRLCAAAEAEAHERRNRYGQQG